MQDSLGGNAKTLMFVNCSPSEYNKSETKNSLDYAKRVKQIKNNPMLRLESQVMQVQKLQIDQHTKLVDSLKELLATSDKNKDAEAMVSKLESEFAAELEIKSPTKKNEEASSPTKKKEEVKGDGKTPGIKPISTPRGSIKNLGGTTPRGIKPLGGTTPRGTVGASKGGVTPRGTKGGITPR